MNKTSDLPAFMSYEANGPCNPVYNLKKDTMIWRYAREHSKIPAINRKENDNQYSNEVSAPGIKKDDFKS